MIGSKDVKVLFIGSDRLPSTCGPPGYTTHATVTAGAISTSLQVFLPQGPVKKILDLMKAKKEAKEMSEVTLNRFVKGKLEHSYTKWGLILGSNCKMGVCGG